MTTYLFDMVGHVDDEALDLYCAQRLCAEDEAAVDQHLRFCDECRGRAEKEALFRTAVRENRDLLTTQWAAPPPSRRSWLTPARLWQPALALTAAALVLMLAPGLPTAASPPVAEVTLLALRGEAPTAAPPGHLLNLKLILESPSEPDGLGVQVVEAAGREIARGPAQLDADRVQFHLPRALAPGQYWVRLSRHGDLLKEYNLRVR